MTSRCAPRWLALLAARCWRPSRGGAGNPEHVAGVHGAAPSRPPTRRADARSGRDIYQRVPRRPRRSDLRRRRQRALAQAFRQRAASAWRAQDDDVLPLFGYVVDAAARSAPADRVRADPVRRKRLQARRAQPRRAGRAVAVHRDHRAQPQRADPRRLRRPPVAGGFHQGRGALPQDPARHVRRRLAAGGDGLQRRRIPRARRAAAQRPERAQRRNPKRCRACRRITHAYVQKLRALSCLLEQADDREDWLRALDRPVAVADAQRAAGRRARRSIAWARAQGLDAGAACAA